MTKRKQEQEQLENLISAIREEFNWLQGVVEDAYSQVDSLEYAIDNLVEFIAEK